MFHQESDHEEDRFDQKPILIKGCQQDVLSGFPISKQVDPPTPIQDQVKLKETSSYGKRNFSIPTAFFDVQSNIKFLNQCNPLSIQLVDCNKYPWYYKKQAMSCKSEEIFKEIDKSNQDLHKPVVKLESVDVIDLTENNNCEKTCCQTDLTKIDIQQNTDKLELKSKPAIEFESNNKTLNYKTSLNNSFPKKTTRKLTIYDCEIASNFCAQNTEPKKKSRVIEKHTFSSVSNTNKISDKNPKISRKIIKKNYPILSEKYLRLKASSEILDHLFKGERCCHLKDDQKRRNMNKKITENKSSLKTNNEIKDNYKKSSNSNSANVEAKKNIETPKSTLSTICNYLVKDNLSSVNNLPKSAYKNKQLLPNTPNTVWKNVSNTICNNAIDSFNDTLTQKKKPHKSSTEIDYYKNVNFGVNYTIHTKPNQEIIDIKNVTAPTKTCIQKNIDPSNECYNILSFNLQSDQEIHHSRNEHVKNVSSINHRQYSCNNNHMLSKTNLIEKSPNKDAGYQMPSASLDNYNLEQKMSNKPSDLPLHSGRSSVQTFSQNMSLPIQTHVSNRPESNKEFAREISKANTSQNISDSLPEQTIPESQTAYYNVDGIPNKLDATKVNGCHMNIENFNMGWGSYMHIPFPPIIYPPPLFLPPPPLHPAFARFYNTLLSPSHNTKNPSTKMDASLRNKGGENVKIPRTETITSNNKKLTNEHDQSTPEFNHRDKSFVVKTKSNEEIKTNCHELHLPPTVKKTDMLSLQHKESTSMGVNEIPKKVNISNNLNEVVFPCDLTFNPTTKGSLNGISYNKSGVTENNSDQIRIQNHNIIHVKKNNDCSSSSQSDRVNKNNNNVKRKPGLLSKTNKSGPFAEENSSLAELKSSSTTVNIQPNKGYSPPILPIPTFQTILEQKSYFLQQGAGAHRWRKRLQFQEKLAREVTKLKKISIENYRNSSPSCNIKDNSDCHKKII